MTSDPEESVRLQGLGEKTLRTAVSPLPSLMVAFLAGVLVARR